MKKTNDRKIMAVCTGVAFLSASFLAGGITGSHSAGASKAYINAKSDEEVRNAEQSRKFWNGMRVAADIAAACGGYAVGLLI